MSAAAPPSADPAAALAFAAARNLCRRRAKDLFVASAFLPKPKRDAACAVFAFCRMLHDALSEPASTAEPLPTTVGVSCCSPSSLDEKIRLFRDRLDDIYADRLELPLPDFRNESHHALHAFALTVHRYQIPKDHFLQLADAWRTAQSTRRFATAKSLDDHCARTGSQSALILTCILGLTAGDARPALATLGQAIAFSRILRAIPSDRSRGRLFLPLEDLARFRYTQSDLAAQRINDNFTNLMRHQIQRNRDLYRAGAEGLCDVPDDGSRFTASILAVNFGRILKIIERHNYDVFHRRTCLTTSDKLAAIAPAWRLSRRKPGRPIPNVF